jgi:tRNA threonylcarbamoyl adenosine modification protein YeaZ
MATGQAERIVPLIAAVAADAGVPLAQVNTVAVTVGPGSFTGTRIGVAAAHGLGLALGVPAVGITTLHVIARQIAAADPSATDDIAIAMATGRGQICGQRFDPAGIEPRGAPALVAEDADLGMTGVRWFTMADADGRVRVTRGCVPAGGRVEGGENSGGLAVVTYCRTILPSAVPHYLRPPNVTSPAPMRADGG